MLPLSEVGRHSIDIMCQGGSTAAEADPPGMASPRQLSGPVPGEDLERFVKICNELAELEAGMNGFREATAQLESQNARVAGLARRLELTKAKASAVNQKPTPTVDARARARQRLQGQLKGSHLPPSMPSLRSLGSSSNLSDGATAFSRGRTRSLPNLLESDLDVSWRKDKLIIDSSGHSFVTSERGKPVRRPSMIRKSINTIKSSFAGLLPGKARKGQGTKEGVPSDPSSCPAQEMGAAGPKAPSPPPDTEPPRRYSAPSNEAMAHLSVSPSSTTLGQMEKELADAKVEQTRLQVQVSRLASLRQQYDSLLERVFCGWEGKGPGDEREKEMAVRCRALAMLLKREAANEAAYLKSRTALFDILPSLTSAIYCLWNVLEPQLGASGNAACRDKVGSALKRLRTNPLHYGYYGAFFGLGGAGRSSEDGGEDRGEEGGGGAEEGDGKAPAQWTAAQLPPGVLSRVSNQMETSLRAVEEAMESVTEAPKVSTESLKGFISLVSAIQQGYSTWLLETKCHLSQRFEDVTDACLDVCKCLQWLDRRMHELDPKLKGITMLYTRSMREVHLRRHQLLKAAVDPVHKVCLEQPLTPIGVRP
eukprot:jgi/Mesvir1/13826/Mv15977-RA.1